jgi:hypothetical protein
MEDFHAQGFAEISSHGFTDGFKDGFGCHGVVGR